MLCHRTLAVILTLLGLAPLGSAGAEPATVAIGAASNFVHALEELHAEFKRSAPEVLLVTTTASSGSLFAQMSNGAPFDVFLSADTEFPGKLVATGLGDAATLRIFATGRLVLWTTRADLDVTEPAAVLRNATVKKIAIAQPRTAPYGRAAEAVLGKLGVGHGGSRVKIVFGETIAQTAQFVETGNADVGFVAMSLVLSPKLAHRGRWHEIPREWHGAVSLDHAAVLTRRGAGNVAAMSYLDFLTSPAAQKILRDFGYGTARDK